MALPKGKSGNPSGRRKETSVDKQIRWMAQDMAPKCVDRLEKIILDDTLDAKTHIMAIKLVLERGFGRPFVAEAPVGEAKLPEVVTLKLIDDMPEKAKDDESNGG